MGQFRGLFLGAIAVAFLASLVAATSELESHPLFRQKRDTGDEPISNEEDLTNALQEFGKAVVGHQIKITSDGAMTIHLSPEEVARARRAILGVIGLIPKIVKFCKLLFPLIGQIISGCKGKPAKACLATVASTLAKALPKIVDSFLG